MKQAIVYGIIASLPLPLGAIIGTRWKVPSRVLAVLLAFAGGTLVTALSFELFQEAIHRGGHMSSAVGLLAGGAVFIGIDILLTRRTEKDKAGTAISLALLAAVVLDGVPENLALGTTLAAAGGSMALLVAIFASNLPEAIVGARTMRDDGRSTGATVATWSVAAVLLGGSVVVGSALLDSLSDRALSTTLAFAGGAVLASLANTVFPEAYKDGGPAVAMATVIGFLAAFLLGAG